MQVLVMCSVLKLLPVSHRLRLAQQTNSHAYNFKAKREFSKDSAQARDVFVAGIFYLAAAGRGSGFGKIFGAF